MDVGIAAIWLGARVSNFMAGVKKPSMTEGFYFEVVWYCYFQIVSNNRWC
jgi:hypothetical protein